MKRAAIFIVFTVMMPNVFYGQGSQSDEAYVLVKEAYQRSDLFNSEEFKDLTMNVNIQEFREGEQKENNSLRLQVFKDSSLTKMKVRYTEPAGIKGTTYLAHVDIQLKQSKGIWLYLPSFDKTKRITANKFRNSVPLVGTGLILMNSNEVDFDEYTYAFIKGESALTKNSTTIEMKPKTKSDKSSKIVEIQNDLVLIKKIISRDSNGEVSEEVAFSSYESFGSFFVPGEITRQDPQKNLEGKIFMSNIRVNQGFTPEDLALDKIKNEF